MKYVAATALATLLALGSGVGASAKAPPAAHTARAARTVGEVNLIQAVPDDTVSVAVDGRAVRSDAGVGSAIGPLTLSAGDHTVTFTGGDGLDVSRDLTVAAGSNNDVVLHLPAAVGGAPTVSRYTTPMKPIGPGRSRVLIAHTATVAPADVRLDGQVVFRNIANGEYATADVASGRHVVALLPTGLTKNPILGPVDVDLEPRTVTMVYAVGDPEQASGMQVIAHVVALRADGSVAPDTIDTGSAGLAAGVTVRPFSQGDHPGGDGAPGSPAWLLLLLAVPAAVLGLRLRRVRT